jgi:predicted Rossmann-fold nucleotide-binding protein
VPILLFGTDYWTRLINFQALVDEGTIMQEDLDLFHYVNDAQQAWAVIRDFYQLGG